MTGATVLVVREPDSFTDLLITAGLKVINFPVTGTEQLESVDTLNACIQRLDDYDGCFFTSPVSAEIFVKAIEDRDRDYSGKVYALGERAKKVLEKAGFSVEFRAEANTAREFLESFPADEFAGKTFLFVRGERSMGTVPELVGLVAKIDEVTVYRTVDKRPDENVVDHVRSAFRDHRVDWACFFSPSAVGSFLRIFNLSELKGIRTAAIGETTANFINAAGLPVNFISSRASAPRFAAELIEYITKH